MQITQITVQLSHVFSLGNYSNVKPGLSLTADLTEDDDLDAVKDELHRRAEEHVQWAIDRTLEAEDKPPHFFDGPTFDVLRFDKEHLVIVIPHNAGDSLPGEWSAPIYYGMDTVCAGRRLEVAMEKAGQVGEYRTVVDCTDGDFSRLPPLEEFKCFIVDAPDKTPDKFLLVTTGEVTKDDLPASWRGWWVRERSTTRLRSSFTVEMERKAERNGLTFLTGFRAEDLARVPDLNVISADEPADDDDLDTPPF